VLVPWSVFWERNYFAGLVPALDAFITNNYVKGAVSGLGLVNIWYALVDLSAVARGRPAGGSAGPGQDG
jgi:hypothetical protein